MAIVVDFATELIEITSPQTDVDIQDLINAIRTAEATEKGIAYGQIAKAEGKTSLGPGSATYITVELLGNWQLHFWAGNYIGKITGGNLVGGPGGDPIAYSAGVQVLWIQSQAGVVITGSGGGGLSEEDKGFIAGLLEASGQNRIVGKTLEELVRQSRLLTTAVEKSGRKV